MFEAERSYQSRRNGNQLGNVINLIINIIDSGHLVIWKLNHYFSYVDIEISEDELRPKVLDIHQDSN